MVKRIEPARDGKSLAIRLHALSQGYEYVVRVPGLTGTVRVTLERVKA